METRAKKLQPSGLLIVNSGYAVGAPIQTNEEMLFPGNVSFGKLADEEVIKRDFYEDFPENSLPPMQFSERKILKEQTSENENVLLPTGVGRKEVK